MAKEKKNPVGRPPEKDKTKSYTVSLKESAKKRIVKAHGSLTKAIKKTDPKNGD